MLDRYTLRYFLAVVDQGNFSLAAASCNVSQPTLSVGIAKLERTLGQRLFVRSNQRVELTAAGTKFLGSARRIEREFNAAMRSMTVGRVMPTLRVGILSSITARIIGAAVELSNPTSDHQFELVFGNERELASHLAKERIDIALTLVNRGSTRFREQPIATEGYALALSRNHPLAGQAEVEPEQVASEAMIVRRHCEALSDTSRFFTERGIRPHFALKTADDERAVAMIAAGLGLTVMPQCYEDDRIARPLLAGFNLRRTIGWMTNHQSDHLLAERSNFLIAVEKQFSKTD